MTAGGMAVIAFFFVIALVFARRPGFLLIVPLVLWLLIPGIASTQFSGIPYISLGTVWTLTVVVAQFLTFTMYPRNSRGYIVVPWFFPLSLALAAGSVLMNYLASGTRGLAVTIDMIVGPVLWAAHVGLAVAAGLLSIRALFLAVQVGMVTSVAVAVAQYVLGYTPVFRDTYIEKVSWYIEPINRAFGLMDASVALGLLCAVSVPLSILARRGLSTFFLIVCAVGGVVLSQSRTALVLVILGVAYVFVSRNLTVGRILAASVAIVGASVLATSSIASGILGRLEDDRGSAGLREVALNYFISVADQLIFIGRGGGEGVAIKGTGLLETSFESGYLIMAYDYGIIFTLLFIGLQIVPVLVGLFHKTQRTIAVAGLVGMASAASFSSIAVAAASSAIVLLAPLLLHGMRFASQSSAEVADSMPSAIDADRTASAIDKRTGTERRWPRAQTQG